MKFGKVLIFAAMLTLVGCGGGQQEATSSSESSASSASDSGAVTESSSSEEVESSSSEEDDGLFHNYKLAIQFGEIGEELPSYVKAFAIGNFNEWANDSLDANFLFTLDTSLSQSEGKNTYVANIGTVAPDDQLQWKVIMGTSDTITNNGDGTLNVPWGNEGSVTGFNIEFTVTSADPVVQVLGNYNFPANPESEAYTVTLTVGFTGIGDESAYVFQFKGSFDGWAAHDVNINGGFITFTYEDVREGNYEFGINVNYSAKSEWHSWYGNEPLTVTGDLNLEYSAEFGEGNHGLTMPG